MRGNAWGVDNQGNPTHKPSTKGTQKRRNTVGKDHFLSVLETTLPHEIINCGFYKNKLTMQTYTQCKQGLAFFYVKREVLDDGISTTPLSI